MIQRIQTLFLLLASACMLIAVVTPLLKFHVGTELVTLEALGINQNGDIINSTWGLFAIGAISSFIALITIFLFKTRMLQIRISIFNIIVMLGFYLYFGFLVYRINPESNLQFQNIGVGIIMPAIAIILTYLAIRKIGADEVLVRSLDRLRG